MLLDTKQALLVKQGCKFAIGATLLGMLFWRQSNLIYNFVYPIFGYVTVLIEPTIGSGINAGLGRLGGSVLGGFIAATLLKSFGIYQFGFFIIPPITYILAALICETYKWQAAYSQATLIGMLIAMRSVGTSSEQDIWIYLRSRLIDNWIGITVGIIVILLFWPQDTRANLNNYLRQFLQDVPRLFHCVIKGYVIPSQKLAEDADTINKQSQNLLSRISKTTTTSVTRLAQANQEIRSDELVEENWSNIIESQNQMSRQLSEMLRLSATESAHNLVEQFTDEFNQLAEHFDETFDTLIALLNSKQPSQPPNFYFLEQDLSAITNKLNNLRSTGQIGQYSVSEALRFYQFLQNLTGFIRELQQLKKKIIHKVEVGVAAKYRSFIKFPKRTPPSPKRILEIIGIGIAIGMILAIIRHIQFPLPEIYSKLADILTISMMVTVIQPTKGRSIVIGMAAIICLCITILFIYIAVKCFGHNPFSSGIAFFVTYFTSAKLGFAPIARIGAMVVAVTVIQDTSLFFDEVIVAAFCSVVVGAALGVLITTVFMGGSSSNELESSLKQTFKQMGQLYQALVHPYFQDNGSEVDIASLKKVISAALTKHPVGIKIAGIEQGSSVLGAKHQKFWNFLVNYEQKLFTQLGTLEDGVQQRIPASLKEKFLPELEAITQNTSNIFNYIADTITAQVLLQSPQVSSLLQEIEAVEHQLFTLRVESRKYSLEELIAFCTVFFTLKEIAGNLNQMSQDLPFYVQ